MNNIWVSALKYQDKRNDEGHAVIATRYALELLNKIPDANSDIVIPAIILHDIGWSQMSYERRMISYNPPNKEIERIVRLEHQIYGVQLANEILKKADYDTGLIGDILIIISQHDTRQGFHILEDAIVRDADKLWRYTQRCLEVAIFNGKLTTREEAERYYFDYLKNKIDEKGFLLTKEAKEIARRDLKKIVIPDNLG